MSIQISALHYYPIKSCGGIDVSSGELDARGLRHDRAWMLVDENGKQLTQRDVAAMALIKPLIGGNDSLCLTAPEMSELVVPALYDGPECKVVVWDDECEGIDQGESASTWFSRFLNKKCRLMLMSRSCKRRVDKQRLPDRQFVTGFADGYPLLLLSAESLSALNEKLDIPVMMNRFRPNIVVDGCAPFEEDSWKLIEINGVVMRVVKPCARCTVVTIDQEDASSGKEPLRTLAAFRKVDGKVLFGQNLAHEEPGTLAVGQSVKVLESI